MTPAEIDTGSERIVHGTCPHDCPDTCAMLITVKDGVATKVRGDPAHPTTQGVLCTKVSRYLERTYSPDRVLYPMRRVGPKGPGQGTWERIGWDEALDIVAGKLQAIAAVDPQGIFPYAYSGTLGLVHNTPCVVGWAGSPLTLVATPSFTVISIAQVSGQSCGQVPCTMRSVPVSRAVSVGVIRRLP